MVEGPDVHPGQLPQFGKTNSMEQSPP